MIIKRDKMQGFTMFDLVLSIIFFSVAAAISIGLLGVHMTRFSHALNITQYLFELSPETPFDIRVSAITAAAKKDDNHINVIKHENSVSLDFTLDNSQCRTTLENLFHSDSEYKTPDSYSLSINNAPYTFKNDNPRLSGVPDSVAGAICQDKNEFTKNFETISQNATAESLKK